MESAGYRVTLAGILESTKGKHLLNVADIKRYTGLVDNRSVKKRFPLVNGEISAERLAQVICGGGK